MSQVRVICPRCGETFETQKSDSYECPKCGTSIRSKDKTEDHDKTQVFKH